MKKKRNKHRFLRTKRKKEEKKEKRKMFVLCGLENAEKRKREREKIQENMEKNGKKMFFGIKNARFKYAPGRKRERKMK